MFRRLLDLTIIVLACIIPIEVITMKNGKIVKTLPNGHEEIIEVDV